MKNLPSIKNPELDTALLQARESLLPEEKIIDLAVPIETLSGIYFLLYQDEIVYVGQSLNFAQRIASHRTENAKIFDRFAFTPCPQEMLLAVEKMYVEKFKPVYNVRTLNCLGPLPVKISYPGQKRTGR